MKNTNTSKSLSAKDRTMKSINSNMDDKQMKQPKKENDINSEITKMKPTATNTITINQVSYAIPEKVQKQINRYKRQAKDITYDSSVNFDGIQLPINNSQEYGAYRTILRSIHTQLANMLTNHSKVFTIRFDLHFNSGEFDEAMISKFFKIIKKEYIKTGQVMHTWVREIDSSDTPHFHCIIGFNGNKIQSPIKVFNSIVKIWCDKMKQPRPHLCEDGNHMISNAHDNIFKDAFKRFSYLAKIRTKDRQPPKKRNYGASQIKPAIRVNKAG